MDAIEGADETGSAAHDFSAFAAPHPAMLTPGPT
jgi:hypothetical protein